MILPGELYKLHHIFIIMAPIFCNDCSIKISGFFKKKFTCQLCLNRFCDKCFSKVKDNAADLANNRALIGQNCLPCIVLQCGQIKREQLFLLKNKQLSVYLNERNISTESCSEKYHLVDLIMEFAETHGIKSGDDLESDVMHRDHVEELRRKAELLRVQEEHSDSDASESNAEGAHFSGHVNENVQEMGDSEPDHSVDTESVDTEPIVDTEPDDILPANNNSDSNDSSDTNVNLNENENEDENDNISEDSSSGAGHQEPEANMEEPRSGSSSHLSPRHQSSGKWYSVEDIEMEGDISSLSVLELKQILAANFIDYRGCCEKKELINKVTMLYQSQQTELKTDGDKSDRDLCKICMDRIIDCVFLDCAHLVACTKCGKKLSECPICRAFIVRVVHIFRA